MKIIPVYEKDGTLHRVMIDDEDYKMVSIYTWKWRDGYATTKITGKPFQLHRMVMGRSFGDGILVDHKNNKHEDCQKGNLRNATRSQNQQNRLTNKGNTLPKGIRKMKNGRYNVRVQHYGKRDVFGSFNTLEEAIEARNIYAEKVHGEFMRPSHLIEENDE